MRVAFIATRISGLDGVSLEVDNWRKIFEKRGHSTVLVAGNLDRRGILIPELNFQAPNIFKIYENVIESRVSFGKVEVKVFELAGRIEGLLRKSLGNGSLPDMLVVPNVFSLPVHFPLAVALERFIREYNVPTIARHHDFWWERERFLKSTCFPFFKRFFPPDVPQIKHITINSLARSELFKRTRIKSDVIWDSFDFSANPCLDSYALHWREDFGISGDDIVFLQATRIVPRKRIELAINLVKKLRDPRIVLVIAGHAGDEGYEYLKRVKLLAKSSGIRYRFIGKYVNSRRRLVDSFVNGERNKRRIYTLWDCYLNSDFVVYPTKVEGFGNQFVESVFFKKPIILTPYPVYEKDIKPLGFKAIEIDESLGAVSLARVGEALKNRKRWQKIAEENFSLGKRFLSFEWVESQLEDVLGEAW